MKAMVWIRGARPQTLPLSMVPVCIGSALSWPGVFAYSQGGDAAHEMCPLFGGQHDFGSRLAGTLVGTCVTSLGWYVAVTALCLGVALFLQIAANFANDYSDGIRGADDGRDARLAAPDGEARQRPPSRLVASGVPPRQVLVAAAISGLFACVCGLLLVALTGHWWFIALGAACLAAGWFYVGGKHPYGYHCLGEPFVFVFFGPVAACGTMYALSGTVSLGGWYGGTASGLVAVALLCINNLRDLDDDRAHGKRTWMGCMGRNVGTWFAIALLIGAPALATLYWRTLLPAQRVQADYVAGEEQVAWHVLMTSLTAAVLLILWVLCASAAIAVRRRNYRQAFPRCVLGAVALAVSFACASMFL